MKMLNKPIYYLLFICIWCNSTNASNNFNSPEAIKKFQQDVKNYSDICRAPLDVYVNDEVILGGKATFEEFTRVFPNNREHYMQMFGLYETKNQKGDSFYCVGRYSLMDIDLAKSVYQHWASLYTEDNAVEWYKITLANLAGAADLADNYPLLKESMEYAKPYSESSLLKALKSLPIGTQRILINLTEYGNLDKYKDEYQYQEKYIFPIHDKKCKSNYCNYIRSLIDNDYKQILYNPI